MKWRTSTRIVVGCGVLVALGFRALPRSPYGVTRAAEFSVSRDSVWDVLTDLGGWPSWRPELGKGRELGGPTVPQKWYFEGNLECGTAALILTITEVDSPRTDKEGRIALTAVPGGNDGARSWVIKVLGTESRCIVEVTELGSHRNALIRLLGMARDVGGELDQFFRQLAVRCGVEVVQSGGR
jgi:polyketide cyclase/dehydrase/lipid transport protein